jgi:hypothetical protein
MNWSVLAVLGFHLCYGDDMSACKDTTLNLMPIKLVITVAVWTGLDVRLAYAVVSGHNLATKTVQYSGQQDVPKNWLVGQDLMSSVWPKLWLVGCNLTPPKTGQNSGQQDAT